MQTKTNYNNIHHIDNHLQKSYDETGEKERYCLTNLFKYMTDKQDNYIYHFTPTESGKSISYDGLLTLRNKLTDKIIKHFIIEAKVRNTHQNYDTLALEQNKYNKLKKKTEEFKIESYYEIGTLYINFLADGTYIFDLQDIVRDKLLPKLTKIMMNKYTIDPSQGKVQKNNYLLDKKLATKQKWIYSDKVYTEYLLQEIQDKTKTVQNIIKKTYSIF